MFARDQQLAVCKNHGIVKLAIKGNVREVQQDMKKIISELMIKGVVRGVVIEFVEPSGLRERGIYQPHVMYKVAWFDGPLLACPHHDYQEILEYAREKAPGLQVQQLAEPSAQAEWSCI